MEKRVDSIEHSEALNKAALKENSRAVNELVYFLERMGELTELRPNHQDDATAWLEERLVEKGKKLEGDMDRHHRNYDMEMEKLRTTVAAQADTIAEQGRLIQEMRREMAKLAEHSRRFVSCMATGPQHWSAVDTSAVRGCGIGSYEQR